MSQKKIYVVVRGIRPGIYPAWSGRNGAEAQVKGYQDALYKGFASEAEAARWLRSLGIPPGRLPPGVSRLLEREQPVSEVDGKLRAVQEAGKIALFTDGACIRNPGPGGYAAVLLHAGRRKEISGGYRRTTNNRMELMACIMGLKQLKQPAQVVIFSDSKYVVDGMSTGRAARWQSAGWRRSGGQKVENADLWEELLKLCALHRVEFSWVKGHAEHKENMRCDALAVRAARENATAVDAGYEG